MAERGALFKHMSGAERFIKESEIEKFGISPEQFEMKYRQQNPQAAGGIPSYFSYSQTLPPTETTTTAVTPTITPTIVQNQDYGGTEEKPNVQPKGDVSETIGNALLNVLSSISQPFIRTGKNIVGGLVQTPLMVQEANARTSPIPGSEEYANLLQGVRKFIEPVGKTEKEFEEMSQRGGKFGVGTKDVVRQIKDSVNIASYGIPFGKGTNFITKAALPGAAVGAIQKATGEENATLPGIIGSATLGAMGSTAFYGLGKFISALHNATTKKLPERLMGTVFKEPIKTTKSALIKGEDLGKLAIEKGEMGSSETIYARAITKTEQLEDELQTILINSDKTVDANVIKKSIKPLLNDLIQVGDKEGAKALLQRVDNIIEANGTKIPVAQANEIKRAIYSEVRKQYGAQGTTNVEGLKTIARSIKDEVGKVSGALNINKNLSYYGRVADSMVDKMVSEGRRNIGDLTDTILAAGIGPGSIPIIVGKAALGSTTGKTMLSQGLSKYGTLGSKIGETLSKVPGNIPQQVVSRLSTFPQPQPNQPADTQGYGYPEDSTHIPENIPQTGQDFKTISDTYTQNTQKVRQFYQLLRQSDEYKEGVWKEDDVAKQEKEELAQVEDAYQKAKDLYTQTKPKETKVSSAMAKDKSRNETALRNINTMEKLIEKDPNDIWQSEIPGSLGARDYRNMWGAIIDAIGTNRTGAAYTSDQRKDYSYMMPKWGDSTITIANKIEQLREEIQTYLNNLEGSSDDVMPQSSLPPTPPDLSYKKGTKYLYV